MLAQMNYGSVFDWNRMKYSEQVDQSPEGHQEQHAVQSLCCLLLLGGTKVLLSPFPYQFGVQRMRTAQVQDVTEL